MPRQNRVTPTGELIAVPDRGLFWGNRGQLLNSAGTLTRYASTKAWVTCVLEYKGRHRQVWTPGRLTELFFLDEATALAAGHRPCGECRLPDYRRFQTAWAAAFPDESPRAPVMDARLQHDRLSAPATRRSYHAPRSDLPVGTMVSCGGVPHLVAADGLRRWSPAGYGPAQPVSQFERLVVITPRCTVAVLASGYSPVVHPTAHD